MAVVVATGVTATGEREILGLDVGDSEDEVFCDPSCSHSSSAAWPACDS